LYGGPPSNNKTRIGTRKLLIIINQYQNAGHGRVTQTNRFNNHGLEFKSSNFFQFKNFRKLRNEIRNARKRDRGRGGRPKIASPV
jgi:hypothetical protein